MQYSQSKIAVIGLGYVGMPLAVAMSSKRDVLGYDINRARIDELKSGYDRTREVSSEVLASTCLTFTNDIDELSGCDIFIVTVPTPVDTTNRPDMSYMEKACMAIGNIMRPGAIVIFECTVYPGATEEVCVPILSQQSGLTYNKDFFCGYSPERINPGDKKHTITQIVKVTSGSTPEIGQVVDQLYADIITAGTHLVSSIAVAEAAKVIENIQRDVNIALINELAIIFNKLNINTLEVLEAAGTKWNFSPFRPGLVGGHCIGVDPYYLTHKAQEVGYHPEMILAGRRINNFMPVYIADEVVKTMLRKNISVLSARILVLGLTFKENCPDLRNTKVVDLIAALEEYHAKIDVYDPWIDIQEADAEYSIQCLSNIPEIGAYDGIILAVPHREFIEMGFEKLRDFGAQNAAFFDIKSAFGRDLVDGAL